MRIIAGVAGGIPLRCPRGGQVRPTMDQVRAAIFSSLGELIVDAEVLDLFAGAGGLGIESLSRGAKSATFVERDRRAVECIKENLEKARLTAGANVVCAEVSAYCARAGRNAPAKCFNLIFADPPYLTRDQPIDFLARLLEEPALDLLLASDGIVVLEKSPKAALHPCPERWETFRQKQYGTAEIVFLRRAAPPPAEEAGQAVNRDLTAR